MYNPLGMLLQGLGPATPAPTPVPSGSDMISTASAVLDSWMKEHVSRTVTYTRGSDSVQLSATPGKSEYSIIEAAGGGVTEHVQSRDYMIVRADLVINGQYVLPQPGDRIPDVDGIFEVTLQDGVNCYEFSDPAYRRMLRIHTKRVEDAT